MPTFNGKRIILVGGKTGEGDIYKRKPGSDSTPIYEKGPGEQQPAPLAPPASEPAPPPLEQPVVQPTQQPVTGGGVVPPPPVTKQPPTTTGGGTYTPPTQQPMPSGPKLQPPPAIQPYQQADLSTALQPPPLPVVQPTTAPRDPNIGDFANQWQEGEPDFYSWLRRAQGQGTG